MDSQGDYYVNDIFDIILPKDDAISIKVIFGYLVSSFVQLLVENYVQRDITSNVVRELPFPNFNEEVKKEIELGVDKWLLSDKTLEEFKLLRKIVDTIITRLLKFSPQLIEYLENNVKVHWKASE